MLDRAAIARLIPHQGSMCLLDAVLDTSDAIITCRASSHRDPGNPLRADSRLGAANGIEYASQAIALHGGLLAGKGAPPRQGYLASVRSVAMHVDRLDDVPGDLIIRAERLSGDDNHILYQFSIEHEARCLLEGRLAVILDAKALAKE